MILPASVSAQDGIVVLRKANVCSVPSLSSLSKVSLKTVPMFVWLNTDHSRPQRVECRLYFLSQLLFPSGDQCCDALACRRSETSSRLSASTKLTWMVRTPLTSTFDKIMFLSQDEPQVIEKNVVSVLGHRLMRKESRSSKYYCEKCNSIIWGLVQEWRKCLGKGVQQRLRHCI